MAGTTAIEPLRGIDQQTYRDVLGRFVTGVTVVTTLEETGDEQQPWGTTVNSFTGISLDPPLVLVSIGEERSIHPIIERLNRFAVNILGETSQALSDCFAAALAKLRNSEIVTGDPEFKTVEKDIASLLPPATP